jgi:peptide/nickel transport system substrate-binding protein
MRYDNESGRFVPWVAQSLEPNADASEWTLKLRTGITFGNGDPLDATAVKASIERHRDPALHSSVSAFVANVASIDVVDPTTVVFHLTGPWGSFPSFLAGEGGMIVDTKVAAARGGDFALNPVGAGVGAYEMTKFAPGEEIVLQAKDHYWDGPVCLKTLRFIALNGGQATYEGLRAGTVDVAFLREAETIARAGADGMSMFVNRQNLGGLVFINQRPGSPGTDLRVRQAIAWAIDPQVIDNRAYSGKGVTTSAIIGPDSRWYQGLEGTPFDPAGAKTALSDARAASGFDGHVRLLCTDSPSGRNVSLAISTQLAAVGFTVTSEFLPSLGAAMVNGDYDLACNGVNVSDAAPYVGLTQFHSKGNNRTAFSNPDFDAAVDALKAARSDDEARKALATIQSLWNKLVPSAAFEVTQEAIVWTPKVKGLEFTQDTNTIFSHAYLAG